MRALTWKGETHYLTETEVRGLKKRLQSLPTTYNSYGLATLSLDCPLCKTYPTCWDCPLYFDVNGACGTLTQHICGDRILWYTWPRSDARKAAAARKKLIKALDTLPKVRKRK